MNTYEHHVAGAEDLAEGECALVRVGNLEVGVFRVGDHYRAWRNVCPHAGAPVCRGRVEGTVLPSAVYEYRLDETRLALRCPWHGWEYDLATGEHLTDKTIKLKEYPVVARPEGVFAVLPARVRPTNGQAVGPGPRCDPQQSDAS